MEDKMKLYSNIKTHETIVEFWGASTKHPDSVNIYQNDIASGKFIENEYIPIEYNIIQWLLYVASFKSWPCHAMDIARTITEHYYNYMH